MADQVELLKHLQAVDAELYRFRRQLEEKPREIEQVNAQVAAQQAKVKAAEERLKVLQLSQKEKEIELQTREANVRKLQSQLFQLKTNKEYTAMQREIDALKADNSLLEEAILKIFDAMEQAAKVRQQEQEVLAGQQAHASAERERIEGEIAALREQVAQLERTRKLLLPDVPPPTLSVYERILDIREGLALVPIVKEACGGCYRRLPPQVINQVYLKATLVTCENCNRILYFDEANTKL